jgi:hypothetical protein
VVIASRRTRSIYGAAPLLLSGAHLVFEVRPVPRRRSARRDVARARSSASWRAPSAACASADTVVSIRAADGTSSPWHAPGRYVRVPSNIDREGHAGEPLPDEQAELARRATGSSSATPAGSASSTRSTISPGSGRAAPRGDS